ncbi:retrovirus-related pol polyprotein from transposon TNT 1-94 [Tanacetum coccineum]|uniref:Retrovirus-related pol polyprotein from transposon TNT 1-94 n=1 Tax=Tanacetum coccineum TaxID=301880 RepID=A0ABQ5AFN5_9ASTR
MNSDTEDDIMDPMMQCITLPGHSSFSQQKLVSFFTEIHMNSIDFLTPNSLPHAHAQTKKTYYKHQDSRIKKARELKIKTSVNPDIQDIPSRYQVYLGRLLASFQDDAKYEHVGQDTRSQGGKDNQDKQGKDLEISDDFQENSNDEVDERSSEKYLRDLDIEFYKRALLANSKHFIKRNNFSSQKANENTECYKCGKKGHFAKDCFSKTSEPSYKSPVTGYSSVSKTPTTFQPKNKSLVAKTFDWDEEEVSDDEEVTQIKSLKPTETSNTPKSSKDSKMESLTPLPPLKNHQRASPSSKDSLNKSVSVTVIVSKIEPTTPSVPIEVKDIEQESKINELTKLVQMLIDKKVNSTQKTQESNSQIQQTESSKILYCLICKREDHRTLDHEMYTASLKRSENYKAQPYQYASPSKQTLKAKAKPFPPCTHYGFNNHKPDDCRNYPECGICGSYDHFTSGHSRVIHIRGGVLAKSSQSSKSSIGVKCNTCGSTAHFTTDHNEFVHFKRGTFFNANKEIVLIAPRRNDVYVLDMSSLTPNGACFFCKASESINWIWHKGLSHLNFKNINKLSKQNNVLGLLSLVYSKDKPCPACEKEKYHRASSKTNQNFSIMKRLHLLHMDLFRPVSPMSINHEKYTLVIVDEMVENQNDVKVKQIRTDKGTEFRNHELESFCDEKGISQNFSSPYTPEQNGVAKRKNRTLIEDARTMLNRSVLSKHFWTEGVRIASFRVFNTRRQQVEETYHVTFDKSMEAIRFNTSHDEIRIDDSSRYPPDEFLYEDDLSRQYQVDSDVSYYVIPHGHSLTELTYENLVPEVIAPNESDIPLTKDNEGPPNLINTKRTHEKNVQNEQITTQHTEGPSRNNTEISVLINESSVLVVPQSHISNQASISFHPAPQDRWSKDQHIELVNIIGDPGEGMLTRSMAAKLIAASTSGCLFADFLSEIEPEKVSEALKHP